MAYKDEYEVARLYTSGDFEKRVRDTFDGDYKIHFNLAPPLFARRDSEGHLRKSEYGAWVFGVFKLLAKMKGLRGGAFDIFGYTAERKMERALIDEYFTTVDELLAGLDRDNHALAVEIAVDSRAHPRLRPHQGSASGRCAQAPGRTHGGLAKSRRGARSRVTRDDPGRSRPRFAGARARRPCAGQRTSARSASPRS